MFGMFFCGDGDTVLGIFLFFREYVFMIRELGKNGFKVWMKISIVRFRILWIIYFKNLVVRLLYK